MGVLVEPEKRLFTDEAAAMLADSFVMRGSGGVKTATQCRAKTVVLGLSAGRFI